MPNMQTFDQSSSTRTRRQPMKTKKMKQTQPATDFGGTGSIVNTDMQMTSGNALATGLGVVSLALGLSEIAFTRRVAGAAGLDHQRFATVLRCFGLREMTSGVGLLASDNKQAWMWSRVIGDLIDGGYLAWAFANERNPARRKKIVMAFAAISPIVALDVYNAFKMSRATATEPTLV